MRVGGRERCRPPVEIEIYIHICICIHIYIERWRERERERGRKRERERDRDSESGAPTRFLATNPQGKTKPSMFRPRICMARHPVFGGLARYIRGLKMDGLVFLRGLVMGRVLSCPKMIQTGVNPGPVIRRPHRRVYRDQREIKFFIATLLVQIHFIIEIIWWTGLAPWEFERQP